MNAIERIIWSADVQTETDLMAALDLMPDLRNVKIDRLFLTGIDFGVIDRLNKRGLNVFDDAKAVEIPTKLEAIARKHLEHRRGCSTVWREAFPVWFSTTRTATRLMG